MTLREKMLAFRAKNNLSQTKAAKLANITPMTWSSIERGIQNPSPLSEAKINLVIEGGTDESISKSN